MVEYRKHLVTAEHKSQEDFDKTVLSLSGGALGISFVFLKDVIGSSPIHGPGWLLAAWMAWGTSSLCVLASYFMSQLALRKAISQVDEGTIHTQTAGGAFGRWTAVLNATGAVLFLVGILMITVFANDNLLKKGTQSGAVTSNPPAASAPLSGTTTTGREKPIAGAGLHTPGSASASSANTR